MSGGKSSRDEALTRALRAWPTPRRTTLEWDESAEHVVARAVSEQVPASEKNVSDEALLAPPLPSTPEEMQWSPSSGSRGSDGIMSTTSRERDRSSLKDLAKLASSNGFVAPPPPSSQPRAGDKLRTPSRRKLRPHSPRGARGGGAAAAVAHRGGASGQPRGRGASVSHDAASSSAGESRRRTAEKEGEAAASRGSPRAPSWA